MAGARNQKGSLMEAFKARMQLDQASKRQFKAGLVGTAVGYVALGAACAADPAISHLVLKSFTWQHLPFHALFIMGTNLLGASAMASYDRATGKNKNAAENTPEPPAPKV
ncbi:MAG: hypothetical protein H6867_06920 [Rhodospirillales bacterium]|nr:hypothetical protein [Rhodospirillales bacterium]MCB9995282.1 hypothetical protein [Rhodospirillales bacterium]